MPQFAARWIVCLLALVLLGSARAHEAESSYLRLRLQPGVLEVRVTFDAFTLEKIVPSLDANRDAALSKAELAQATLLIQQFIQANVGLKLDEKDASIGEPKEPFWPLDAPDPLRRERWHDQTALILFPFDLPLDAAPQRVSISLDGFGTIGQAHRVFTVFEEAGRSQPVLLSASRPAQAFASQAATALSENPSEATMEAPSTAGSFFWEGIKHILEGYDHICFLLALLLVARRLRQVVLIVTAFTVAHSITLILAARGVVHLPSRLIECAIAGTIVFVAVENLLRKEEPRGRWLLTFVFGLIHGFGFANVLGQLELPQDAMLASLLLFNVGVEAGQIALVIVLWPLLVWLGKSDGGRNIKIAINLLIGLLGLAWLADRAFELEWMPF